MTLLGVAIWNVFLFIRHCIWSWSCQQQDGAESGKHLGAPLWSRLLFITFQSSSLYCERWHLCTSALFFSVSLHVLPAKGLGLMLDWTLFYFFHLAGGIPIFLAVFYHLLSSWHLFFLTYLLLTGPCHTLGFSCMSQVPHPSTLTSYHSSRLHG